MKQSCVLTILGAVLCILVFCLVGCSQPGETLSKGHRRHLRNLRINQQQLVEDIDTVLLLDEPSKLSKRRIPAEIQE